MFGKGDGLLSEFVSDTYKNSAVKIKIRLAECLDLQGWGPASLICREYT